MERAGMTKQHICRERPEYKKLGGSQDPWTEGPLSGCPYHAQPNRNQTPVKMGKKERAAMDKAAGVLGRQNEMGSYTGTPE